MERLAGRSLQALGIKTQKMLQNFLQHFLLEVFSFIAVKRNEDEQQGGETPKG